MANRIFLATVTLALAGALALGAAGAKAQSPAPAGTTREFTIVNIKFEGSTVMTPGPIIVKKGDHVKIRIINNIKDEPAQHGFAIDAFKVKSVVNRGKPETLEFDATEAGIFPIYCQLHKAHVGTELVVLE